MLFAAGFGTRMGALTRDRPKPLIEVAGRTLLDHALALVDDVGCGPRVGNVHWCAELMAAALARRGLAVSREAPAILDTGGGLRAALPLLLAAGPIGAVCTLNTDAVWTGTNPLRTLAAAWDPARMDVLLALVPLDRATGHSGDGDFALHPGGRLTRGGPMVHTGAQIVDPAGLDAIAGPAFSMNVLWDKAAARGRLFGFVHDGGWCDVGRPEGIALAEAMLEAARVRG